VNEQSRYQLFETARSRAGWSGQQLWVAYLAVGGTGDAFEIDAFLQGLAPLTPGQQDALAAAVNERLVELYLAAQVPYLHPVGSVGEPALNMLSILDGLLEENTRSGQAH
jgi:hypothetical protein